MRPLNSKDYRDELYRLRAHPQSKRPRTFEDSRDSFAIVYLSVLPFLVLEYLAEKLYSLPLSGLVFPIGFLLFWAFFYTYYQPQFLEEKLSKKDDLDLQAVPALIVGVFIYFAKITVVKLGHLLIGQWFFTKEKSKRKSNHQKQHANKRRPQGFRANTHSPPPPRKPKAPELPTEVMQALRILGLENCRNWDEIHHRYRHLAKQYHPDLNPDITQIGTRFMMYDAAYRKLSQVKKLYFVSNSKK